MSKIDLKLLLGVLVITWGVCCVWVHGPAILAYIAMQAATSGVFAFAILKSLKQATHSAEQTFQHRADNTSDSAPALSATTPQAG